MEQLTPPSSPPARPEALSLEEVAALLEDRLFEAGLSLAQFVHRCQAARDNGLAAVICEPTRVALAAHTLSGSTVQVATAATVDPVAAPALDEVLRLTERLVQDGATVIGLVAGPQRLEERQRPLLAKEIRAVAELVRPANGHVRAMLSTAGMSNAELVLGCQLSVDSGATMVQGGTWLPDDRTSLSQIALMRQTIGDSVVLKWTAPVRSVERLLLAHAEGVDRFNGDPVALLRQAASRARDDGLRLPRRGIDYECPPLTKASPRGAPQRPS